MTHTAFNDNETKVLLAVMSQHRPTVRSLSAATGIPQTTVHKALHTLRHAELVAFEDHLNGTLRATCGQVR